MYIAMSIRPCFHFSVDFFRNIIPTVRAISMNAEVLMNAPRLNEIGFITAPIPRTRLRLTIMLPITFPNARSPCPMINDFIFTTSSGVVVPIAMNIRPMKKIGMPSAEDMFVVLNTNHLAAKRRAIRLPVNTNMSCHIFLNVTFFTSFTFSFPPTHTVVM